MATNPFTGKPLATTVTRETVGTADVVKAIEATRDAHRELISRFHQVWYECQHTWGFTNFLGVGVLKNPLDLWVYQMLITQYRPKTIIETGTAWGGSALWYAFLMDMLGIEDGKVFTIDIENNIEATHPRITFVRGDSTDPWLANHLWGLTPGPPYLLSLDADHSYDHVSRELAVWGPRVPEGSWMVVEDTNVSWEVDGGAMQALREFLQAYPGQWAQDLLCERYLLTMHPGGWLRRVKPAVF